MTGHRFPGDSEADGPRDVDEYVYESDSEENLARAAQELLQLTGGIIDVSEVALRLVSLV
jgi:hypothetical protein